MKRETVAMYSTGITIEFVDFNHIEGKHILTRSVNVSRKIAMSGSYTIPDSDYDRCLL